MRVVCGFFLGAATGLLPLTAEAQETFSVAEAVDAPDWLKLSGSFRARYETLSGQFRPGLVGDDQLLSLRTTLLAEARGGNFRIGGELADARGYLNGRDGAAGTGEINALELIQGYVGYRTEGAAGKLDLQLGRFTMDLGSRRLVGRNNFRNTTNAFTGLRADWTTGDDIALTLFYTLPHIRLPDDALAIDDNEIAWDRESEDLAFWGGHFTRSGLPLGGTGEAFVLVLHEQDAPDRGTRDRQLTTWGGRLFHNPEPGEADFEFEGGLQRGTARATTSPSDIRDLDVEASYAHLEVGRTWDSAWKPRVSLEYDYASGDASSSDDTYGRFDSLYGPRRPDFGPTGIYGPLGRSNLSSPGVRVEVQPTARWDAFVFYRALWLDEAADAFANTGIRDATGTSGTFAGHQLEVRARYWIIPRSVRLDFGGATLIAGDFLKRAPNRTGEGDTLYGYADVTWTF